MNPFARMVTLDDAYKQARETAQGFRLERMRLLQAFADSESSLREAFLAGRIDVAEFEDRLGRVLAVE